MMFRNREEAGGRLAGLLAERYRDAEGVVYALPRGGVPLGAAVARELQMPLDLVIPRKIGHPGNPEYAVCAVTEGGELLCDEFERTYLDEDWLARRAREEVGEARRRRECYLAGRESLAVKGKLAIVVDDGIATGLTMRAAILDLKARRPARIVVAIPVIPADTFELLQTEVDEVVAILVEPNYLGAVGSYYMDFPQLDDRDVVELMAVQR
ncbi:MAG: phosphoribosyl transferase [Gammaproteobacteria bacterium]|nr:MAG: phosphoribosyl transferase [Gammaproteobacteria bacterium]